VVVRVTASDLAHIFVTRPGIHVVKTVKVTDSVTGVVSTLSRLRLHVSSMNPVATAIWLWKRMWNMMIPASRYAVEAPLVGPLCVATYVPRLPHRITSISGQKAMSNHRCGARHNT
jgi:hypothetical protein